MNRLITGIAFVVALLAFPIISVGTETDTPALWWMGLVLLLVALLVPVVLRFVGLPDEHEAAEEEP